MAEVRIAWARKGDDWVYIQDAAPGLAADCTCAECGELLTAVKGDVRQHYFRHQPGASCPLASSGTGSGTEEAQCRLAVRLVRQALERLSRIQLPDGGLVTIVDRELAVRLADGLVVDQVVVHPGDEPVTYTVEVSATRRQGTERLALLKAAGIAIILIQVAPPAIVGAPIADIINLIEDGAPRHWLRPWGAAPRSTRMVEIGPTPASQPALMALRPGRPLPYDITALRQTGLPLFCSPLPAEQVDGTKLDIPEMWLTEQAIRLGNPNVELGPVVGYWLRFDGPAELYDYAVLKAERQSGRTRLRP